MLSPIDHPARIYTKLNLKKKKLKGMQDFDSVFMQFYAYLIIYYNKLSIMLLSNQILFIIF